MKNFVFILCFLIANTLAFAQDITLKDIVEGKYKPQGVKTLVSSHDGNFYYQSNQDNNQIIKYSYRSGLPVDTILNLSLIKNKGNLESFNGFLVSPTENRILIFDNVESVYRHSFRANYYHYDAQDNSLKMLTNTPSKQMVPSFSEDGRLLVYVSDNNLFVYNFEQGTTVQVTSDGLENKIINGAADWVYEEEFATTSIIRFSPDNNKLAFVRFDESEVQQFSFPVFNGQLYPSSMNFKYPKSGEVNSSVTCNIYDIASGRTDVVHLDHDVEYIPRIEFVSDSQLAIMTLNRHQNNFKMFLVDTSNLSLEVIFQEKNKRYINYDFFSSIFFLDDSFTYISERDGYSHIYLFSLKNNLPKQLTSGTFDVTGLLSIDKANETLFYQAADESPMERSIHKLNFKQGKESDIKLSKRRGYNSAQFSSNGKYFVNNWSDVNHPNIISVVDTSGEELRILEDNLKLKKELKEKSFSMKEFITLQAADGTLLNGWLLKSKSFNKKKKYPLLMIQYSGPDSQQVLNQFGVDWFDYLVGQGYLVACVDGRGTGARGEEFRKCTYGNLGIKESDDQIAAARYFAKLPFVDEANISIWGWSYGGYNVLMCLSRSQGVFKKGIAIAPVTDWRFYDSVYTERYMRTPQENPFGYDNGAPLKLAKHLSGDLLLVHGSADDNVHFQNSMEYVSALVAFNKNLEMFVFPDLNHSLPGVNNREYLYNKIIRFLLK